MPGYINGFEKAFLYNHNLGSSIAEMEVNIYTCISKRNRNSCTRKKRLNFEGGTGDIFPDKKEKHTQTAMPR